MSAREHLSHPSYLELDRLALGAPAIVTTAAHIAGCLRCRDYLEGLRQMPLPPIPVDAGAQPGPARAGWFTGRRGWLLGATGVTGVMALGSLLLWLGVRDRVDRRAAVYDGSKGLPSVWIYVKRDNDLLLWDGRRPLAPGDRLRLKIDPQGLTHVDVFTREDGLAPISLFSGGLAPGAVTTLPAAWQIDGGGGRESLIVVLANRSVSAVEARRFADEGAPAGVWLRRFELRPVTPPGPPR